MASIIARHVQTTKGKQNLNDLINESMNHLMLQFQNNKEFSNIRMDCKKFQKYMLQEAYDKEIKKSKTPAVELSRNEIAAGVFLICFLNGKFELPERFLLVVSFLLNKVNIPMILFFMPEDTEGALESLSNCRNILKLQLKNQVLVNLEKKNKNVLHYLYECCTALADKFFLVEIKREISKFIPITEFDYTSRNSEIRYEQSEVVPDGEIYSRDRDPPGQKSVYIPPGDTASEKYRLGTFIKFPASSPVNPRELAAAGFYFTGFKDRVKCFSCSLCVENWTIGDDVKSSKWHREECEYKNGRDQVNIPISVRRNGAREAKPQSSSSSSTSRTQGQPPPTEGLPPAGEILLGSSYQTARPLTRRRTLPYLPQTFVLAETSSPEQERLIRSLDVRREQDRLRTFRGIWDVDSVSEYELARHGFFYLGNFDRVQCFSCGGVLRHWHYGDNVHSEHRQHFPNCKMVMGVEPRNQPIRREVDQHRDLFNIDENELRDMFPCLFPVNPHMREVEDRLATFDRRWPVADVRATPQQITEAGFFFLGERDRVKCWYCNGGLQNWEPDDDPWTEHAKWFPQCEFLLQKKGLNFVTRLVALYPDLPRPNLRGGNDVPPDFLNENPIVYNPGRAGNSSPPPQIIDPRVQEQEELAKVEEAMKSEVIKSLIEMGYAASLVKKVVLNRIRDGLGDYTSVATLMDDVTVYEENNPDDDEDEVTLSPLNITKESDHEPSASGEGASSSTKTKDAEERIRELQDERKCKVCLDKIAEVVFVPCGHLCCCINCATVMKKCPICRRKIEQSIRTYHS